MVRARRRLALIGITRQGAAPRDLIRHFAYLGENGGVDAGRRFLTQARQTFVELASSPHLGATP